MKTGIIDYGGGNLRSVANALRCARPGSRHHRQPGGNRRHAPTCCCPARASSATRWSASKNAASPSFLKNWIAADKPYFGICVGYQILFDGSEESPESPGLGILPGHRAPLPGRARPENPAHGLELRHRHPRRHPRLAGPRRGPVFLLHPLVFPGAARPRVRRGGNHPRHPDIRRCRRARKPLRLPVPPGKKPGSRSAPDPEFPRNLIVLPETKIGQQAPAW